jgi:hypothetical protein
MALPTTRLGATDMELMCVGFWDQVKSITVDASITGALLKDVRLKVDTTQHLVTIKFAGQDKRAVFEPHRVVPQAQDPDEPR